MARVVALDEADLRTIFGDDFYERDNADTVRTDLDRAADSLVALGNDLAGRAGCAGRGLEVSLVPSGQTSLEGFVDPFPLSFYVELRPVGYFADDDLAHPGWNIEATISIRCDAPVDCGMHLIETVANLYKSSPAEAAHALVHAVDTRCVKGRGRFRWRDGGSWTLTAGTTSADVPVELWAALAARRSTVRAGLSPPAPAFGAG